MRVINNDNNNKNKLNVAMLPIAMVRKGHMIQADGAMGCYLKSSINRNSGMMHKLQSHPSCYSCSGVTDTRATVARGMSNAPSGVISKKQ